MHSEPRFRPRVEPLETRLALTSSLSFTDVDGDAVRIVSSVGDLSGTATFADFGAGQQLQMLDLTAAVFQNANIATFVTRSPEGDGLVNIGGINATGRDLGRVSIKGDLGMIDAGDGVSATSACKALTARSLGRFGTATGAPDLVSDFDGRLGKLAIKSDVIEATILVNDSTGTNGKIGALTIGGSLIGGAADDSGKIHSIHGIGVMRIGGNLQGGSGSTSGKIRADGPVNSVFIGGSIIGGAGGVSGHLHLTGDVGTVQIRGDVLGGTGNISGAVQVPVSLSRLNIGGSVRGGLGGISGHISVFGAAARVQIGGDVVGGLGTSSGTILALGQQVSVNVAGSLVGGSATDTGAIAGDDMAAVRIGGNIKGSSINGTQPSLGFTGYISAGHIGSLFVGGSIISGIDNSTGGDLISNATIHVANDLGTLTVKGSLIGNATTNGISPVIISARGQASPTDTSDVAIGKISIGGRVEFANILAGYDTNLNPVNGNAQIGTVSVATDWIASNLVAGVEDGGDPGFGDEDDDVIGGGASIARITTISIGGMVLGTIADGDQFGFVSHSIGTFLTLGVSTSLANALNGIELSPLTEDVVIREF